ncbi:matrilysin-like isoform X1 [Ostrea edulis]|uniref:matrilysin-like isoform X1 n=1 Tax=Ostrea edulis TaxID=37623 RepID=UPI0024AEC35C|nr:matrilysin-like isoform X1 [Ostrea edulis]
MMFKTIVTLCCLGLGISLPLNEKLLNIDDYLIRFGYFTPSKSPSGGVDVSSSDADRRQAIWDFQKFSGLEATGEVDEATILKMRQPRCGVADKQTSSLDGPQNYLTIGKKWPNKIISWKAKTYTEKLPVSEQRSAFKKALQYWSKVTPLKFEETAEEADIKISFGRGEHGDGIYNAFDGKGGVLAHAYYPTSGETHFDDDELWTYQKDGTELQTVAAHEFGHSLGLGHSREPGALMAPFYKGFDPEMTLHQDDINGIQSLYGKREATTRTSTSTEAPTTTIQTATSARFPCNMKVDAVTNGPDGYVYFFRRSSVYKMGPNGVLPGYPRPIRSVFPGAPAKNVGSAFHIRSINQTVILKGNKGWSFNGFVLKERFNISVKTQAAVAVRRSGSYTHQIYLFQAKNFYELNYKTLELVPGFPLSTKTYWSGMPLNVEAGMQLEDGNLLLFKGNKYSIFDTKNHRILPGYPKSISQDWLGQSC